MIAAARAGGAPPVVFLGPSMPVGDARLVLDADYRPPIRRGDLEALPPGTVVGMIDGVFEQHLAVSPREVRDAVARGVRVVGGASMGALRAAEVPGVVGVGLVFAWYRDGVISRDDEVALVFDAERGHALSVPLVNVRFAVERLCRPGTIDRAVGDRIIAAAAELPYHARSYRTILARAGLSERADTADLVTMLEAADLKRQDAQVVLETIEQLVAPGAGEPRAPAADDERRTFDVDASPARAGELLIWESGDRASMAELIAFLGYLGRLEHHGRAALARFALEGNGVAVPDTGGGTAPNAQAVLTHAARRWGWISPEEARVTLADLGIPLAELGERCQEEATATAVVRAVIADRSPAFQAALRSELYLDDLALKREVMRLGALRYFAGLATDHAPDAAELVVARQVICKHNDELELPAVRQRWAALGLADERAQDDFIAQLARARRAARGLVDRMARGGARRAGAPAPSFALPASRKPPGERRFSLPLAEALAHADRLREVIGVTRIGMIGELSEIGGVQVAQASRPDNQWSSTYGSGKSLTKDGAIVGSILEETEKWAQERFAPAADQLRIASFLELVAAHGARGVVDPATLDLPYDTVYRPELTLAWFACAEVMTGEPILVPLDVLQMARNKHDICYTRRGARKHLATNGLGSGFTRAEAVLHAICEYVERHALRLAELSLANPGGLGPPPYRFIDLASASARTRELAARLAGHGATVRVLDITSEIAIPTFQAVIMRDGQRADGHAAHPDAESAIEMALLEAAQTISCAAAGGREDLSIHARSLGRHERPRPLDVRDAWFWLDPDPAWTTPDEVAGFASDDLAADVAWSLDQLHAAGIDQVIVLDLTAAALAPAHVVRAIVPGLESNNPFYTGPRGRLALLRGLAPVRRR
ncbi:MAG TPA: YcaO-like family protein [Kofleriaceae bacterium]|nr:YcaO-like family protein [Kofleriaceae bacterium]